MEGRGDNKEGSDEGLEMRNPGVEGSLATVSCDCKRGQENPSSSMAWIYALAVCSTNAVIVGGNARFLCVDCPDLSQVFWRCHLRTAAKEHEGPKPWLPQRSVSQHQLVLQREVNASLDLLYADVIIHM